MPAAFEVVDFATLAGVSCPCGTARRAFAEVTDFPATVHVTNIDRAAQTHYHRLSTEVYYILSCSDDAVLELNEERLPLRPGMCVLIRPGTRHRAVGELQILLISWPKFDPSDEYLVETT
jgi:mannose-6-phosphate isomerase-like protein (cupin superfamily)